MNRFSLLLVLVLLVGLPSDGSSAPFTELVAFGDSLTDMGNRGIATNANSKVYPRETWVKQMAGPTMLNIPHFERSGKDTFEGGTNYAFGGATTAYIAKMGLGDARGFNLTRQITGRYLNPAFNTGGVHRDALHVLRIGGNDLSFAAIAPEQILMGWEGLSPLAKEVAKDAESQVQALASAGVKHVLWLSLSDPAAIPLVVSKAKIVGAMAPTLLSALTKATTAFNVEMDAAIDRLQQANPGLLIVKVDMSAMFHALTEHPDKFGFTNITDGADDDAYLFSKDKLHPTTHGHHAIAEFAFAALQAAEAKPAP